MLEASQETLKLHAEPSDTAPMSIRMIHEPGSEVTIWGNIKARIEYAIVEAGKVSYRVRFWSGTSLASETIDEGLILEGPARAPIGFRRD